MCLRLSMRYRWLVLALSLVVIASQRAALPDGQQGLHSHQRGRRGVRGQRHGAGRRDAPHHGVDDRRRWRQELQQVEGITTMLTTIGSSGMSRLNPASIYVRLIDMEDRVFSLGRLWRELLAGQPRRPWRAISRSATRCRRSASVCRSSRTCGWRSAIRRRSAKARRSISTSPSRAPTWSNWRSTPRRCATVRAARSDCACGRRPDDPTRQTPRHTPPSYIPGLVDTDTTLRLNKPELLVEIDRERAASLGVDVAEIAETLRIAVGGDDRVSRYRDPALDDVYDVELRLVGIDRGSPEDISQLYVRTRAPPESPHASGDGRCRRLHASTPPD